MLRGLLSKMLERKKKKTVQEQEYSVLFHYRYGLGETFATETEIVKMRRKWPEFMVLGKTPVYSAPNNATLEDLLRIQDLS